MATDLHKALYYTTFVQRPGARAVAVEPQNLLLYNVRPGEHIREPSLLPRGGMLIMNPHSSACRRSTGLQGRTRAVGGGEIVHATV